MTLRVLCFGLREVIAGVGGQCHRHGVLTIDSFFAGFFAFLFAVCCFVLFINKFAGFVLLVYVK